MQVVVLQDLLRFENWQKTKKESLDCAEIRNSWFKQKMYLN